MEKREKRTIKLTPAEYAEILEGFQLDRIALHSCRSIINLDDIDPSKLSIKVNIKGKHSHSIKEEFVEVFQSYSLVARNNKNKKSFVEIEANYRLIFTSSSQISEDFLEIYQETSLEFVVWPFFRELVHNMSSRMDIPPLTIPFVKA